MLSGPSHHPADFPSLYRTFPLPFVTYPEDGPITDEKMDSPDHGLTNERTDLLDGLTQSLPVLLDLALLYHCSSYLYPCSLLFGEYASAFGRDFQFYYLLIIFRGSTIHAFIISLSLPHIQAQLDHGIASYAWLRGVLLDIRVFRDGLIPSRIGPQYPIHQWCIGRLDFSFFFSSFSLG